MKEKYSIIRKFPSIEQAKEVETILNKNGIETRLADNVPPVDITFSGSTIQNEFEIQINESDFLKANEILENNATVLIDNVNEDHYLFDFTNEELYDVLLKYDEWSAFDYTLAKKILIERGEKINREILDSLKAERVNEMNKPEPSQKYWIIAGYIFSILGGFLGLIIGYFIWTSKKSLPNGEKIYSYNNSDRKNGKYIFYIGLIIFPILFILKVIGMNTL